MADDPIALPTIVMKPPNEADDEAAGLMEIAAAIDRIAAEIAIGERPTRGAFDAIERIADIAFVLHERSIEQTLCDGLDAAVRDLSDACGHSDAAAEHMHNANALLGALAIRVRELIGSTPPRRRDRSAAATVAVVRPIDEKPPSIGIDIASLGVDIDSAAPPRPPAPAAPKAEQVDKAAAPRSDAALGERRPNDDLLPPLDLETGAAKDRTGTQSPPAHADESSAMAQASPRPLTADALAAVRALSEEELIALFS